MPLLKKIIKIFYPRDETDAVLGVGTPIPDRFKYPLERTLWTFINFALERTVFHEVVIEPVNPHEVNLFAYKTELKERKEKGCFSYGSLDTLNDDFKINVDIKTKQNVLILFTVYVSEINGKKTDLIFRFDNENGSNLLKADLHQFISRVVNTLI